MLFLNVLNEVYEDGAKAAYKNCLDMLEEANILYTIQNFLVHMLFAYYLWKNSPSLSYTNAVQ
jgi:hypothetical protein